MIKVIKHGEKTFKTICPVCGCEFEYSYEDVESSYLSSDQNLTVKCPDCGHQVKHQQFKQAQPYIPLWPCEPIPTDTKPTNPLNPYVTWTGFTDWPDCDKCPNKPDPNKIVVGDTPCTWCKKNQPYCFTGDKFPADYKGGSYSVNPEDFKNVTYTNTSTTEDKVQETKPKQTKKSEVKSEPKKETVSSIPDAAKYFDK